ncbi:glycosyltransferase [Maridesulfovibrio hydrothermalis]|uniref:Glycosyltransferase 2-like domain-containing protein n=1 Tax=Maridesulfovibrio hydrothermalis AM13 = DSM 14728 TaxID=1121451 RepID=L0RG55_9BACT|nr:glycosyltransferase [Maridesulfovibrio hydrothermalis]CCO25195.1 conserved protein of unknown function [Maridesulfovibrio hydrothermalis AM13 = DSM 14728]
MNHCFDIYSKQILSFKLSGQQDTELFAPAADIEKITAKHLKLALQRNAQSIILFGLSDALLAAKIMKDKPAGLQFIICDLHPEHVRKIKSGFPKDFLKINNTHLLTDSSIWAHLLLLIQNDFAAAKSHLILNPDLKGKSKEIHQKLQKLFSGLKYISPTPLPGKPKISAAAILSTDEPDLESFISSFPDWLEELVLVWDCAAADSPPSLPRHDKLKIINIHHPLNADFSAQRNRMIKHCSGDWIIYLDADERLDNECWNLIKILASIKECDGWYLPRITFYPDKNNCRAGYGLWPDLQLRLFRNLENIKFINKIHEQLQGITGNYGIIPTAPISHLTHLLKSRTHIKSKLDLFNEATDGIFQHKLNAEFPNVPAQLLKPAKNNSLMPVIIPEINM